MGSQVVSENRREMKVSFRVFAIQLSMPTLRVKGTYYSYRVVQKVSHSFLLLLKLTLKFHSNFTCSCSSVYQRLKISCSADLCTYVQIPCYVATENCVKVVQFCVICVSGEVHSFKLHC